MNNSQNSAFEELCCQLAAYEIPQNSKFIRKAAPDAGVECYCHLHNGDEWGWQAKFFTSRPEESQWAQLDKSVKTALSKHPRLTVYTICLPIDRQDPRIPDEQWFMDEWDSHVKKWCSWAEKENKSVEFNYWGSHEILERLSREEHRGRYFFWFNKDLFSHQWFNNRIEEAISNAGPRYSPELNVDLPIARLFDGLGRTSAFYDRLIGFYTNIKLSHARAHSRQEDHPAKSQYAQLDESANQLLPLLYSGNSEPTERIRFDSIADLASKVSAVVWEIQEELQKVKNESKQNATKQTPLSSQAQHQDFGYQRYSLSELEKHTAALRQFAKDTESSLANIPALLMVGGAGTGKTHLFCDLASHRISQSLPTVLLLGEQFGNEEPWSQVIKMLGLSCTKEELLGSLEAAAQAAGSKALILIDALNEGEGKNLWRKHIAGMLTALSHFPWIAIAVSVRTSYEGTVIPDGLIPNRLIRAEHNGFANNEFEATLSFFNYYGILAPSVPLLNPEFQNPLFLKLFCKGLKNKGLTEVPVGLQGITAIFNFFVESVNERLSKPEYLDFDLKSRIVQRVVDKLVEMMAERDKTWLPREEAQEAVNEFLPRQGYENSLFRHLISEGILAEDRVPVGSGQTNWVDGVHISYERLSDHLVIKHLLDKYLDTDDPTSPFSSGQPLGSLVADEWAAWRHRGLIEALSIQIPERVEKELVDCVPQCADWHPVLEAFVESIMWRNPTAIHDATFNYINGHVIQYEDSHNQFLNALITVSANAQHLFNADFLDKKLKRFELAERDAWWSIFLHHEYRNGDGGPIHRLINWAWSSSDKSHISDESIRLCATILAWFLTTSNRFLRDRATKALVSLLTKRIDVLRRLIFQFLQVDEPYVLERLYGVAYGCAMRSTDDAAIEVLATDIYNWVFKNGEPPPHILLRDYARGVIETALYRGSGLQIDAAKIRPPYKSAWPDQIPTEEELAKYDERTEEMSDKAWGRIEIYNSVMGFEDFARYVIGTNSHNPDWTSRRLNEPPQPTRKEIYESFVNSLTERQKKALQVYESVKNNFDFFQRTNDEQRQKYFKPEVNEEIFQNAIAYFEDRVRKALGKKKLRVFNDTVLPYLKDPLRNKDELAFDLSLTQRWILQKVFDLGWTEERFGAFDRNVNRWTDNYRTGHKPERIGKKYQWIAYHEFLARLSDNFEFRGDSWSGRTEVYEGSWQVSARDIDPSCLLNKTGRQTWGPHIKTWWAPESYTSWNKEPDERKWLQSIEDLPSVELLIEIKKPGDASKWLVLESFHQWKQPTPLGEDASDAGGKEIWYILKSYIVKKTDIGELFEWAQTKNFMGDWMPNSHELYEIFLGEFFWSPAYHYFNIPYYHHSGWTRGHSEEIPKEVLVSVEEYLCEGNGFDCSMDESYRIKLPTSLIVDGMNLRWNGTEGHLFDEKGELIAFDPSVKENGPGSLLIKKAQFLKFLDDKGYAILWTLLGEKNDYTGGVSSNLWRKRGRLQLSGAYILSNGEVKGIITPRFLEPPL